MATPDVEEVTRAVGRELDALDPELLTLTRLMVETSSPPGCEEALALELARWGRSSCSAASWSVEPVAPLRANLEASYTVGTASAGRISTSTTTSGLVRHLGFVSHLDTSLTGDPARDVWITGATTEPSGFRHDQTDGTIAGFGLAVAKGPAAAAIIAFRAVVTVLDRLAIAPTDPRQLSLLIAAGGTHRAPLSQSDPTPPSSEPAVDRRVLRQYPPPVRQAGNDGEGFGFGIGVRHALDQGLRPTAVINAKAGPWGVLFEEPGALYVRVSLRDRWGPVMYRRTLTPDGGLLARLPDIVRAIEGWRATFRARPLDPDGQAGREAGIGAIRAGEAGKPDLVPGLLELGLYVITAPGDQPDQLADELRREIVAALPDVGVAVEAYAYSPAGRTDPDAPIVRVARATWRRRFGHDAPTITQWTGSTDSCIFRSLGIDTVRVGPSPLPPSPDEPRLERLAVADLSAMARLYADMAIHYLLAVDDGRDSP